MALAQRDTCWLLWRFANMNRTKTASALIFIFLVCLVVILAPSSIDGAWEQKSEGQRPTASVGPENPAIKPDLVAGLFLRNENSALYESGAQAYAQGIEGLTLEVYYAGDSAETQMADLGGFIKKYGAKGIFLLEPVSEEDVRIVAELAEKNGVYWSSVGESGTGLYPMDYDTYTLHQGVDQREAGYNGAETLFSYMDQTRTNFIFVLDMPEGSVAHDRQFGLNRALGERLDIVVAKRGIAVDRKSAEELVTVWLEEHEGDLGGIWCADDQLALGAMDAAEKLKRRIPIVGIQPSQESMEKIIDGRIESIYTYDRIQGAYGIAAPYLAAAGIADISELSSAQRYFYVPQVAINSKNAESVLGRINSVDLLYPGNWTGKAIDIF